MWCQTDGGILCKSHIGNADELSKNITAHLCNSFIQKKGDIEGKCEHNLLCTPIKQALLGKPLFDQQLGYIICKNPYDNVRDVMYRKVTEDQIKSNYKECLEK